MTATADSKGQHKSPATTTTTTTTTVALTTSAALATTAAVAHTFPPAAAAATAGPAAPDGVALTFNPFLARLPDDRRTACVAYLNALRTPYSLSPRDGKLRV